VSYCLNINCKAPRNHLTDYVCQHCGTDLVLQQRYRAIDLIGQGGFGVTFLAIDEAKPSKPRCVIKQFSPHSQGNSRKAAELFQQEAVRLEQLGGHPQIPELYAHFEQAERQYIVQEFIDGQNLMAELQTGAPFDEDKILIILLNLLPVLQFIHQGKVIHRDIKPENIIRRVTPIREAATIETPLAGTSSPQGAIGSLVLVDFGAAKYAPATALEHTGTRIGSAEYVSPEQRGGKAVFASDLYSLGVTCLHLLTRRSPFDLFSWGDGNWVWRKYLRGQRVSNHLATVLDRLVAPALKNRYQTADEALAALQNKLVSATPPITIPVLPISPAPPIRTVPPSVKSLSLQSPLSMPPALKPLSPSPLKLEVLELETIAQSVTRKIWVQTFCEPLQLGLDLIMVVVPAGNFRMGSEEYDAEKPMHGVALPEFCLSRYPITQAQFQVIMGQNPSQVRGDRHPVDHVSWDQAAEFCQRLALKTGRPYRLPSESEWEYACRAGTTTPFYYGVTLTPDRANYGGSIGQTSPVGQYPTNAFGLSDLHGNVWEWCADFWHENYQQAPTDGSVWQTGGDRKHHVLRGGSWREGSWFCRSSFRFCLRDNSPFTGFRVACPASVIYGNS